MVLFIVCSAVAAVYAVSSYVLFRKPHWLHVKKRPRFLCRNIAHRGGAAESIENSLLAFDNALICGTEMLEIDCRLTADGHPVVYHDPTLLRCTGKLGKISDFKYHELPQLHSELQLYYKPDVVITSDKSPIKIPLLKDLFERYPTTPINLDVKENDDELIHNISELIKQYKRENYTYWGSFSHIVSKKLDKENSRIVRFFSLKEAAYLVVAFWTGILPYLPLKPGVLEIPFPGEVFHETSRFWNRKFRAILYFAEKALNNKSLFKYLKRRGIPVYVWILNNESEFNDAFNEGVTGVMTDYPTRLSQYVRDNEHKIFTNDFELETVE